MIETVSRANRRIWVVAASVCAALVLSLVVYTLLPVRVTYSHPSYAFEVSDRAQVAGYSDYVVVGHVQRVLETTFDGPPRTTFEVSIETVLKGDLAEKTVTIGQRGVDLTGKSQVHLDGVSVLTPGNTYVMALRRSGSSELSVLSGPHSPAPIQESSASSTIADWQRAVVNQRWPDGVPRDR